MRMTAVTPTILKWVNRDGKVRWQPGFTDGQTVWSARLGFWDETVWREEEGWGKRPKLYRSEKRAWRIARRAAKRFMTTNWEKI